MHSCLLKTINRLMINILSPWSLRWCCSLQYKEDNTVWSEEFTVFSVECIIDPWRRKRRSAAARCLCSLPCSFSRFEHFRLKISQLLRKALVATLWISLSFDWMDHVTQPHPPWIQRHAAERGVDPAPRPRPAASVCFRDTSDDLSRPSRGGFWASASPQQMISVVVYV